MYGQGTNCSVTAGLVGLHPNLSDYSCQDLHMFYALSLSFFIHKMG